MQPTERLPLNVASPVPLYHQMEIILFERICTEGMTGKLMPSEAELGAMFGVSRMTVKKALENLTLKGYLDRRRALGTRITRPQLTEDLARRSSYTEEMEAHGLATRTKVLQVAIHTPDAAIQHQLGITEEEQTLCIRRLRGNSETFPVVLLQTEIPLYFGISPDEDFTDSLYRILEQRYGISLVGAEETIFAAEATLEQARLLEIPRASSVLVMERVTFAQDAVPVEFVRGIYRPDRYKYFIRLKR